MSTVCKPNAQPLYSIQYLRGIAAILVDLYHKFPVYIRFGEHGVDLFFVISGFIMSSLTAARKTTPSSFIIDRLTRIVPVYWLVTLATVVSYRMHLLNPSRYTDDNIHLLSSLLFIPRFNAA